MCVIRTSTKCGVWRHVAQSFKGFRYADNNYTIGRRHVLFRRDTGMDRLTVVVEISRVLKQY